MLSTTLSRLYVAIVTTAVTLYVLCQIDRVWFDQQMFPYPNPTAWTWSLWIATGLAVLPWIFAAIVLVIAKATGRDQMVPVPVRARSRRQ